MKEVDGLSDVESLVYPGNDPLPFYESRAVCVPFP
jgi:hypothetical protein